MTTAVSRAAHTARCPASIAAAALILAALVPATLTGCTRSWGTNRPIARVDEDTITERQWVEAMVRKHGARELLAMIDDMLIRSEAERLGIKAPPQRVRAKVDQVIAYLGSREELDRRLSELGMTFDEFRRRCETLALLDLIALSQIKVTKSEIVEYYKTHQKEFSHGPMVRARMMLFSDKSSAEAVLTALKEGGDFAGLAKALSEDPATAPNGGDMGWFEKDEYAPEISKVAFSLKPGQTSGVFKGPDGWYILKVEGRRPAGVKPLRDVEEDIRVRLQQQKLIAQRAKWLQQKRQEAALVIKDKLLRLAVRSMLATAPPPAPLPGVTMPEAMIVNLGGAQNTPH